MLPDFLKGGSTCPSAPPGYGPANDNDRYEILEFLNVIAATLKCLIIVVRLYYIILYIITIITIISCTLREIFMLDIIPVT